MPQPRPAFLSLLLAVVVAVVVPFGVASARSGASARPMAREAGGCGPSGLIPSRRNLARVAEITLCLINRVRAAHGLPALHANPALTAASARHSDDMVRRGYFSHDTPQGVSPSARISRSGYGAGRRACAAGENIAAATGPFASPHAIVDMWMNSPGHRANILDRSYHDTGLGVAYGYPGVTSMRGATYTEDFGRRC
jgi:uncharacterized protein YkwD